MIEKFPKPGDRSEPSVDRWMENFALPRMPVYGVIYMAYGYNTESARKSLRTRLKKGNSHLGKLARRLLDKLKKMASDLKYKGKNTGYISDLQG